MDGDGEIGGEGFDCDDTDPSIHHGAEEIPYDGIDQDCDGSDLTDVDGYGLDSSLVGGEDCDDEDADINPGAEEVCDGVDNDCDGEVGRIFSGTPRLLQARRRAWVEWSEWLWNKEDTWFNSECDPDDPGEN